MVKIKSKPAPKGAPSPKGEIHEHTHGQAGFEAAKQKLAETRKNPNTIGFLIAASGRTVHINADKLDQEFTIDRAIEIRDALSSAIVAAQRNVLNSLFVALGEQLDEQS